LAKASNINLIVLQLKLEAIHGGNSKAGVQFKEAIHELPLTSTYGLK
jgi:hypothetical protein